MFLVLLAGLDYFHQAHLEMLPYSVQLAQGTARSLLIELASFFTSRMIKLFKELDQKFAYLLNWSFGGLPHLVNYCTITFIKLSLALLRVVELIPSGADIFFKEGYILLILVSLLGNLFVLILELDHVVLKLEYLLLLRIANIFHFDYAVLKYFVRFLEFLHSAF
jgi:hypothetical protein